MRRVATVLGWAVVLLGLAGIGVYVGLLVQRRVSPPIAPIDSRNRLEGYATGDSVLLRDVQTAAVEAGDVLAVRLRGRVVVGEVRVVQQQGSQTSYVLGGARGRLVVAPREAVVGRADRKVPLVGWVLLGVRNRLVQLAAGAVVVAFLVSLVLGRRTPLDLIDARGDPFELSHRPLALGTGQPTMTAAPAVAYVEDPMSITPDDLRQVRFAQTRKGYDTEAVDRALDTVADSIEAMLSERQQLIDRLRALEAEVERYKAMESQLGQTLAMAEKSAEQVKADAQAEAARILSEAQAAGPAGGTGGFNADGTMVELLGETRAIRSLLQAVLAQGGGLPNRPPQQ